MSGALSGPIPFRNAMGESSVNDGCGVNGVICNVSERISGKNQSHPNKNGSSGFVGANSSMQIQCFLRFEHLEKIMKTILKSICRPLAGSSVIR